MLRTFQNCLLGVLSLQASPRGLQATGSAGGQPAPHPPPCARFFFHTALDVVSPGSLGRDFPGRILRGLEGAPNVQLGDT